MATASAGAYRPRHPERTVLYRVFAQHFDRFVQVYDERFAPTRGPLPRGAREAVNRYLDCGIFACGFARVRCGECGHDYFVAFSCKLRCICPSCHMKRELIWAEWARDELLEDVAHRQVVFTIPKRLRPYFRYERALLGDLAGCAWRALRLWVLAYFEDDAAVPGAVGFIQTAGELLNWHPHVHLLVSDGVFDGEGAFERFTFFDTQLIERLFRAEVLRLLMDRGLISQEVVDNLLSWRNSGFSVHADVKVADRQAAARLGRYMIRCPVVVERMSLDEDTGEVIYRTRPSRVDHPEGPVTRWDVYELIGRVLDHLPAPNQQMVRYWGFYSNVARGKRRAAARRIAAGLDPDDEISGTGVVAVSPVTDDEPYRRRVRLGWAALIKKVYEIDPLLCPYCGGEMKIIAFITEHATVAHILEHIRMPAQRPEPLAHSPPLQEELLYAS
ncbi:MAG: transposase [Acidobacteriota bacterium]|jgi:hypothetical protein